MINISSFEPLDSFSIIKDKTWKLDLSAFLLSFWHSYNFMGGCIGQKEKVLTQCNTRAFWNKDSSNMCSDFPRMWKQLRKLPELQSFHINLIFHKKCKKADEGTCPFSSAGKTLTRNLLNPHYAGNHIKAWQCGMLRSFLINLVNKYFLSSY